MPLDLHECETLALKLPIADRATLAERLIESLEATNNAENENLWVEEAERRYQAYKRGDLSARPVSDALREARLSIR